MKESEKTLFRFELSVRSARRAFQVVTLAPSANPRATLAEMRYEKFVVSAETSSAAAPARFPRINNFFLPYMSEMTPRGVDVRSAPIHSAEISSPACTTVKPTATRQAPSA